VAYFDPTVGFVSVTDTLATTAPDGSVTSPTMLAMVCPKAAGNEVKTTIANKLQRSLIPLFMLKNRIAIPPEFL
jgi:hypothetical protein